MTFTKAHPSIPDGGEGMRGWERWLAPPSWAGIAALGCVLAIWSLITGYGWVQALLQRSDLDYTESWHAYCAQQAAPNGAHVDSAYAPPHNVLPYPPLGYILNGAAGKLLGGSLEATRSAARALSLLMTLLSALLIALLGRLLGVRWGYALLTSLVFLNLHSIQLFAVSVRPDALALALTLLAVYLALAFQRYALAGAVFALAVFAKHSYIAAPGVVFLLLMMDREWRAAVQLAAGAVAAQTVCILAGFWFLGAHWWEGPLLQGFHGAKPAQVIYLLAIACRSAGPVIALGLACGMLSGLPRPARMAHAIAAASFLLNALAMVKPGASMNYLLEPAAFCLVLTGYLAERFVASRDARTKAFVWSAAAVAIFVAPFLETVTAARADAEQRKDTPGAHEIVPFLRGLQGPILATESWMYFQSGHAPWVCPSDLASAAVEGGIIPESPMTHLLAQRSFKAIVISPAARTERPFPKAWREALQAQYASTGPMAGYEVLVPKASALEGGISY